MRVALVADWLPTYAGAEHVISALRSIWPDAPIFTTIVRKERIGPLADAEIHASPLQRLYRMIGRHQPLLPLMPRAMEDIDLREFDIIVSSSHAVGKGIVPPSNAVHVCYCHTPMRYAWEMENEYLRDFHVPRRLIRRVKRMLKKLRRWDMTTAKRVDVFLANSRETAARIERIYGRSAQVIPPPVDDRFFLAPIDDTSQEYFLSVGRLIPYKRIDLLIALANAEGLPLKIAGTGSEEKRLRAMAGPTVEFLGFVPDENLPDLYRNARAVFFPPLEDAGVVPLESQACGTPVIAYGRGGATDTVIDGVTGILVPEQTTKAFADGLERFQSLHFDRAAIRDHARKFSLEQFTQRVSASVSVAVQQYGSPATP